MKHIILADAAISPFGKLYLLIYDQLPFILIGLGLAVGLTIFFIVKNKKKNNKKEE